MHWNQLDLRSYFLLSKQLDPWQCRICKHMLAEHLNIIWSTRYKLMHFIVTEILAIDVHHINLAHFPSKSLLIQAFYSMTPSELIASSFHISLLIPVHYHQQSYGSCYSRLCQRVSHFQQIHHPWMRPSRHLLLIISASLHLSCHFDQFCCPPRPPPNYDQIAMYDSTAAHANQTSHG